MSGIYHAGIVDSDKKLLLSEIDKAEGQLQEAIKWQDEQFKYNIFVKSDETLSFVNSVQQLGNPLYYTEFERKLKLLNCGSKLIFKEHSLRPFKALYYLDNKNRLLSISPYGRTLLPEFSTMILKPEIVRDFSVRHLKRNDMPAMEWQGLTKGYVSKQNEILPGWKKIYKYWGENADDPMSRGWRTLLVRMVGMNIVTPTEVERVFGPANKKSWAIHMGKRNEQIPW